MKPCENCGGDVKFPVMHGMRRLCSQQCREMVIQRERVFVAPKKMDLHMQIQRDFSDECSCPDHRPRGDP